jgi:polyisoprenoid-binding protein YceI
MDRPVRRIVAVIAIVAVIGAALAGLYYLFLRPEGPAPVAAPSSAPAAIASPSAQAVPSASGEPSTGPAASAPSSGTSQPGGGIDGTWTVDPSIGSFSDFSGSFVGYRVQEELANIGGKTAVGRTPDVTGTLTLDGSQVTAVDMTADLTTLRSDDDRRDGQLRRQALETGRFPEATFRLTSPIDLGSVPADGQTIEVDAVGELTIHGQTRGVTIPLTATLAGDVVTVTGSTDIVFADYGMKKPESFIVLSVDDHGIMEFQLHFRRG